MKQRTHSLFSLLHPAVVSALIAVSVLAGCEKSIPLEERVQAYWDARKARNFVASYKMEDPRSGIDENRYISRLASGKVVYESVNIAEIQREESQAQVTLEIAYSVPGLPKSVKSRLREMWYRIGRQWYHQMPVKTGAKQVRQQGQPPASPPPSS